MAIDKRSETQRGWWHPTRVASLISASTTATAAVAATLLVRLVFDLPTLLAAVAVITSLAILIGRGAFRTRMVPDTSSLFGRFATASVLGVFAGMIVDSWAGISPVPPMDLGLLALALVMGLALGTHVGSSTLKSAWSKGKLRSRGVIIGSSRLADELMVELRHRPTYGLDVVGLVTYGEGRPSAIASSLITGGLDELSDVVDKTAADRLIIGPTVGEDEGVIAAARWATRRGMPVYIVPRFYTMGMGLDSLTPDRLRGYPLVRVQRSSHPMVALRVKRLVDLAVSGTAIVALSPVMAVAALAVRLTSPGPVLFTQERIGQDGKVIAVPKFRSMAAVTKAESDNEWNGDKRITPVGNILRRTAIDELPQLFLIFKGDMSLVGPRPERPSFVERFAHQYPDYQHRHRMKVGLTGLAQVAGLVGDTSIAERVKYDNIYIDQWTLGMDFQIIFKTVWSILRQSEYKARQRELELVLTQQPIDSGPRSGQSGDILAGMTPSD